MWGPLWCLVGPTEVSTEGSATADAAATVTEPETQTANCCCLSQCGAQLKIPKNEMGVGSQR